MKKNVSLRRIFRLVISIRYLKNKQKLQIIKITIRVDLLGKNIIDKAPLLKVRHHSMLVVPNPFGLE